MGDEITQAQAVELLAADVERHADGVRRLVDVPLTQNQFDSLVSLVFNIGIGAFQRSTLLKKLNDSDYEGAQAEFARWVYAGGRRLKGLERRREAEAKLFGEDQREPGFHWFDEVKATRRPG